MCNTSNLLNIAPNTSRREGGGDGVGREGLFCSKILCTSFVLLTDKVQKKVAEATELFSILMDPFSSRNATNSCSKNYHHFQIGDTLYTLKQLVTISQILRKRKEIRRLINLLNVVPVEALKQNDQLLNTTLYAHFHEGNYEQVISMLSDLSMQYRMAECYHRELQSIWDECHYKLFERDKGKYPQEVQRFRIRKKHTYPACIWNGDKFKYSFTLKDREIMEKYFRKNPKPNRKTKEELAEKTHLTVQQGISMENKLIENIYLLFIYSH